MTLRTKTLLAIGSTLFVLILILYFISRTILQGGFKKVETDLVRGFSTIEQIDARRNVMRAVDALNVRIDNLSTKASDWSQWDDCYKFAVDKNKDFIASNFNVDGVLALKLNYIMIFDADGKPAARVAINLDEGKETAVPKSIDALLRPGSPLLTHADENSVHAGLVLLPENPLLIVSRPVLKSDGSGPSRGSVIFARYLDNTVIEELSATTHLKLNRHRADEQNIPGDFARAAAQLTPDNVIVLDSLNTDTLAGYTEVSDIAGNPALFLRVDIPRDIHKQGTRTVMEIRERARVTLLSMVVSILLTGLVLGLVILVVLERIVLSRLAAVSRRSTEIGEKSDFTARVETTGSDEIRHLADAINKMLADLSVSHAEIGERNAEMQLLMNTIPAGLLSLNENFVVNPEYSAATEKILGQTGIKGRPITEVLNLIGERTDEAARLLDFLDVLRKDMVSEETMSELNPCDELAYQRDNESRWLRTRFYLIRRGADRDNHLLMVMEDITKEKKLAIEVLRSQKENMQLKAIAEDPDLFREFLLETRGILRTITSLAVHMPADSTDLSPVHEIFRGVHTIKGVAGSFGLSVVVDTAAELEDRLDMLRLGKSISAEGITEIRLGLDKLGHAFNTVVNDARKILGDDLDHDNGIFLRISLDDLKRHMAEIQAMDIEEELKTKMVSRIKEEILSRLRLMQSVPARRGLGRAIKVVPGLINRLGKDIDFRFEGGETLMDCETAHELNTPLMHMIRNAFDHGIEDSVQRLELNKPEKGMVTLAVGRDNGHVVVTLTDDGRGLNPDMLRAAAVKHGVLSVDEASHLSREHAFGLIFRPGFSTASQVTDVSGRGVGLDAVLESVRSKLKGEIKVDSQEGRGTRFTIRIPA